MKNRKKLNRNSIRKQGSLWREIRWRLRINWPKLLEFWRLERKSKNREGIK